MIYLIKVEKQNIYKIGYSNNIKDRFTKIQTACPFNLSIYKTIKGGYIKERILHRTFLHRKTSGEWFNFNKSWFKILVNTMDMLSNLNENDLNVIQNDFYTKEYENIRATRSSTKSKLKRAHKKNKELKELLKIHIVDNGKQKNYLKKRKEWYNWKVRAQNMNIPLLKNCRPTQEQRLNWEQSIIKAESTHND